MYSGINVEYVYVNVIRKYVVHERILIVYGSQADRKFTTIYHIHKQAITTADACVDKSMTF